MELSYWRSKWRNGQIGFHMKNGYPGLEKHWHSIPDRYKKIVLVPLCGKSKDLFWLSENCEKVIGVEISEIAIQQFFKENSLTPEISTFADFKIYRSKEIEIWNGDFFNLPKHKLPPIHMVFDRAALVALPLELRKKYTSKIMKLIPADSIILLQIYHYKQKEMGGPPFSVSPEEVKELFGKRFHQKILEKKELNVDNYKNFQNRGLHSYFIEILSLLLPVGELKAK